MQWKFIFYKKKTFLLSQTKFNNKILERYLKRFLKHQKNITIKIGFIIGSYILIATEIKDKNNLAFNITKKRKHV